MLNKRGFWIFVIVALALVSYSLAALTCSIVNPGECTGGNNITLFYLQSETNTSTNAHAQNISYEGYELYNDQLDGDLFNMTENVLLMHLNNDSAYGENCTFFYDFSGLGNNGTAYNNYTSCGCEADCLQFNPTGGKIGGAFEFDSVYRQRIQTANNEIFNMSDFTISLWLKQGASAGIAIAGGLDITGSACNFSVSSSYEGGWMYYAQSTTGIFYHCNSTQETGQGVATSTSTFTTNNWNNIVVTFNADSNVSIYLNGNLNSTKESQGISYNRSDIKIVIGCQNNGYNCFNGSIDEVAIYNRTLSAEEIFNIYRRGVPVYSYASCCGEGKTGEVFSTDCGTTVLRLSNDTNAHVQNNSYGEGNYSVPICLQASLSTIGCSYESSCSATKTCLASMASSEISDSNGTNAHLADCNYYTTNICCSADNTPPEEVTLYEPINGNETLFNRTVTFQWSNITDVDGDSPITYNLQIDEVSSEFQSPVIDTSNIVETANLTTYSITDVLNVDTNYSWRVRAYDNYDYGNWSENWTFIIQSSVILSMPTDTVDFGEMNLNDQNDTTDDDPPPLVVRNDGNALTNVNISLPLGSIGLWDSRPSPTSYFQYKIDNKTGEIIAFNQTDSITYWQDIPVDNISVKIIDLNWSDENDEAEIDLNITVPSDEPAGNKSSTLIITGILNE